MAKELNAELLEKERENLVQQLNTTKATVLNASNQVQQIMGAIQMTDSLIAVSKEGNYSKSRANSEGVPEGNAAEVQKSLEEHAKDMVSEIGDDDLGKVD
jgi:HKD family nuclease|tara:strand:- start:128 stop:427 length:300 start_codon:yes stop_codon:yes gene_type:complete